MNPKEIGEAVKEARERRRWSQETLAHESGGIGQSTIDRIERGDFKRMPSVLPALCAALEMPLPMLGTETPQPGRVIPARQLLGRRDFEIFAAAEGGPGEIIVNSDPIDFVPRPGPVEHVREAYGLVITGTSMIPEYKPGETALVNPLLPTTVGDEVYIFYAEREGEARATIKLLRRTTADAWLVSQHNPPPRKPKDFQLPRREWRWAHRVIGKFSRS